MDHSKRIHTMVLCALLIAIGCLIPIISPIKVMIPPASFTLASHVAIMVAMFVSPVVAVATAIGTTVGFFLYGFPFPIVLRALTHVIWAFAGAWYLKKYPQALTSIWKIVMFMIGIGIIHSVAEIVVSIPFYFGTSANDFAYMIFGLIGAGTMIHSCVDFVLSVIVWKILVRNPSISGCANVKEIVMKVDTTKKSAPLSNID